MPDVPPWKREMQAWILANEAIPKGAIVADLSQQAENNSYTVKAFYADEVFTCRDCGVREVWTAEDQRNWFEVKKGSFYAQAVRCKACREKESQRIKEARRDAGHR